MLPPSCSHGYCSWWSYTQRPWTPSRRRWVEGGESVTQFHVASSVIWAFLFADLADEIWVSDITFLIPIYFRLIFDSRSKYRCNRVYNVQPANRPLPPLECALSPHSLWTFPTGSSSRGSVRWWHYWTSTREPQCTTFSSP